jgi:hypothetical protein
VLAILAYHIIDPKKNPSAERMEAPFLFFPPFPFPSLSFFFWGYATNPLSAKRKLGVKNVQKKKKGIYIHKPKINKFGCSKWCKMDFIYFFVVQKF